MSRPRKLFLTSVFSLLVVLAAAATAVVVFRVEIANLVLPRLLAQLGYPDARVTVVRIGSDRTVLRDLRLDAGGQATATRIEIAYRPRGLLAGRLDAVTVTGLHLGLGISTAGIDWGPLAPLLAGHDGGGRPPLQLVGPATFPDARLALATPWGKVAATVDATATLTANLGTTVSARLGLAHPAAHLDGRLDGHLDEDGGFGATLDIADGASRAATLAFSTLTGDLDLRGRSLADLAVSGRLAADHLVARGIGLGNGRLSGHVDAGKLDVSLVLPGAPGGLEATARVQSPDVAASDPRLAIEGDAAATGLSGDLAPWPGIGLGGRVVYHLTSSLSGLGGVARALARGDRLPADARLSARLDADLVEVTLEQRGTVIAAQGGLSAETAGGRLLLRLTDAAHVDVDHPTPDLASVSLDVSPAADEAPLLKLGPTLGDPIEAAATVVAAPTGLPPVSGSLQAALQVDGTGTPFLEDLRADVDPVTWQSPWGALKAAASTLHLQGTPDAFSGRLTTTLTMPRLAIGNVRADGLRLPLALSFDGTANRVDARDDGCLKPEVQQIEAAGATLTTAPLQLCPADPATPLLRLVRGAKPTVEVAAALRPVEASAMLHDAQGHETAHVTGALPRLDATLHAGLEGGEWSAKLTADGGDLAIAPASLTLRGLDLRVDATPSNVSLDLRRLGISDRATPGRFAPLHLAGHGDLTGEVARFQGRLAVAGDRLGADLTLVHNLGSGDGDLTLELPSTDLGAAGVQIETLAPVLKGDVTRLRGRLGASAEIAWQHDAIAGSTGALRLDGLAFATLPAEVAGLSGTVAFSSLLPLATPPDQRLKIGFLDPGFPLADGEVAFQLKPGPVIAIDHAAWPFAGGRLVSRGVEIDPAKGFKGATLDVEDVSVSDLLKIAAINDLAGSGRLSGRLPLVMEDGTPTIRGAELTAGGGVIRYTSQQAAQVLASQGGSAEILAKALRDFHYKRLSFTADGPLTGGITAGIHLNGANPELYDGKPIELNVSLEGDLRQLMQSASVIEGLPESIRRQIDGGGKAGR